jgi:hypothetical protein
MRALAYLFIPAVIFLSDVSAGADETSERPLPCVEVQIGQDRASQMDCMNDALRRIVEREHNRPLAEAPISANSPSNTVGTFNDAAARQMMGDAFGVSAVPQRPKNTFASRLLPVAP